MGMQEGDGHAGRRWAYVNGMGMQVVLCTKQIITDLDKQIRLLDHTSCFGVALTVFTCNYSRCLKAKQ